MKSGVVHHRLITLGILATVAISVWVPEIFRITPRDGLGASLSEILGKSSCPERLLCVYFLNVGQGDAIFIESPSGQQMLVDGGRDSSVLHELGVVMGFWDREIDYILATHPDADHVSGLADVLEHFSVAKVIRTENESDTTVWTAVERAIEAEGSKVYFARRAQLYDLGDGVKLEILFPDIDPSALESNTASIVARLVYDETSFILTGDSPKSIEEYLVLAEGEHLKSDVLKVGHHGSRTSTSELFLAEVGPEYAVISAGKDNSYGHPHLEVTDALFNAGVKTFNTADVGRVMFISDGLELTVK